MSASWQAKETEYLGTRFRSKSEAIFARAMDLAHPKIVWTYEPTISDYKNYTTDFYVQLNDCGFCIEYKPSMPTETYVTNLAKQTASSSFPLLVVSFSAFDDTQTEFSYWTLFDCPQMNKDLTFEQRLIRNMLGDFFLRPVIMKMREARNYRFDLALSLQRDKLIS